MMAAAFSYFDKYQCFAVLHDEIDLAALATKIAFDQDQSILFQIFKRTVFTGLACNLPGGARINRWLDVRFYQGLTSGTTTPP